MTLSRWLGGASTGPFRLHRRDPASLRVRAAALSDEALTLAFRSTLQTLAQEVSRPQPPGDLEDRRREIAGDLRRAYRYHPAWLEEDLSPAAREALKLE